MGIDVETFPRFRDCYLSKDLDKAFIYARTGGMNREEYLEDIQLVRDHHLFVKDYDDEFDNTFMYFEFKFPTEMKDQIQDDIEKIKKEAIKDAKEEIKYIEENIKEIKKDILEDLKKTPREKWDYVNKKIGKAKENIMERA